MIIVEVGSLNMDLVVRIPEIPKPGETLMGGVFHTYPGGKGANQAVAAARLGAQVHMIGCLGGDAFGGELRQGLIEEKVDTRHVFTRDDVATGIALIQVDNRGRNSIAVASGANLRLTVEEVENALNRIGEFDALMMPLEIPLDVVEAAALAARGKGAKVILNPAPAQVLSPELLRIVSILIPNEHELATISGIPIEKPGNLEMAADKLHKLGLAHLVVTLGSRGCYYSSGETRERFLLPATRVPVVDTTAAGDCFVAALTVALCEGQPIRKALEFANAAASISVTRTGAQPSLPYRDEVTSMLQEGKIYE